MRRIAVALVALGLIAAACGGEPTATTTAQAQDSIQGEDAVSGETTTTDVAAAPAQGVLPEGPSALETSNAPEFPAALVDPAEIISGGPPPDGIPPLDDPAFIEVAGALELLNDAEPVVVVEIEGDARAYPVQVMIWHEIVNDTVGGVPVAVTYCPLCNSAVSYRREVRGVETTFGTSGRLFASALVMYDRATETLWTHFDGRAVVGLLAGDELEIIASPLMSWGDFRAAYPTGLVLDPATTGFVRDYGRNPYFGYDDADTDPFLFRGAIDDRSLPKQRVIGIELGSDTAAFTLEAISGDEAAATNTAVGSTDVVILWKAGQSTALESDRVDNGRDVGTVGVFIPIADGRPLTFRADGGVFTDNETGTVWSITGEAVEGDLAGTKLDRVAHLDTFWFAWATYQPGTVLVEVVE